VPVGSATSAVPPQILAALAAIAQTQAAELQAASMLAASTQAAAALNPNLGQVVNLSA
jgi:hypothetical protein